MIQELKNIVARVEELNLYNYTSWYLGSEVPAFPAFIIHNAAKRFEPLDAQAKVYNARLEFSCFILDKIHSDDAEFDDMVDKTLKHLASNSEYHYAELKFSDLDVITIEEYDIKTFFFKMEYLRRETLI